MNASDTHAAVQLTIVAIGFGVVLGFYGCQWLVVRWIDQELRSLDGWGMSDRYKRPLRAVRKKLEGS